MNRTAHIAIVGGGPAGLSSALHLRALDEGLRVTVLEREVYPRDKICAGAIGARALPLLARLGVDLSPELGHRVPSVRIDRFVVDLAGRRVDVRVPGCARVVRRIALDHALADAALARGVDVRTGQHVTAVSPASDHVLVEIAGAAPLRADVVVGADGIRGVTRRALGMSRGTLRAQAVEVDTERTALDLPTDAVRFQLSPALRGYRWDFPTPVGGRISMSRGVYLLRDERGGATPQEALRAHLAEHGLRLEDHAIKQLAERGFDPTDSLSVPRVLLVGEAAGIDFPTGEGIAQALAYGEVVAPYLVDALKRGRLDFLDWRRTLLRSAEGRFLYRRWLGGKILFGTRRALVERALSRSPRVFEVALARFAGHAIKKREIAAALAQLVLSAART